jgi:hypothetical protein
MVAENKVPIKKIDLGLKRKMKQYLVSVKPFGSSMCYASDPSINLCRQQSLGLQALTEFVVVAKL